MKYSMDNGLFFQFTPSDIEKIEYIKGNEPTEQIQNAYNRIKPDIIINANFFDMKTGATLGVVYDEGKLITNNKMGNYGYAFIDKKNPKYSYENNVKAIDFCAGYPPIMNNGKIINNCTEPSLSMKSSPKRGRTVMADDGKNNFYIICIPDSTKYNRKTLQNIVDDCKKLGCINIVSYDGGGSSSYISPWGKYISGRAVDGFIAIWLKKSTSTPTPTPTSASTIPKQTTPSKPPVLTTKIHIVKKNETLSSIAKLYKTTITKIAKDNNIKNVNKISVGQKLTIK